MRTILCKTTALALWFAASCAQTPHPTGTPTTPPVATTASTSAARELTAFKAKVMAADYRGDLEGLARLRDEGKKWHDDPQLGHLAHYWTGFASWRIAANGANHEMSVDDLRLHLQRATTDFYQAIHLEDHFADAYAAAASVNGWLASFHAGDADQTALRERVYLASALLSHALVLDPDNPRVLWVKGGFILFSPGGSPTRAIAVYEQMLAAAERSTHEASTPLPDWGRPEALMSLAFARLQQKPPDLPAAREAAREALRLEPEWSYVRDDLLPQIEQQLGQR